MHYSTHVPNIAAELFDGEVVVANYLTGAYYSLAGTASTVWQGLQSGMSVAEITNWLSAQFPADAASIAAAVEDFVGKLASEGVIAASAEPAAPAVPPQMALAAYAPPLVERFDDLADLLLLDPVHDVTEAGWPHLPEKA